MTLRDLPSVQRVLTCNPVKQLVECYQRQWVVDLIRQQLEVAREIVHAGDPAPDLDQIVTQVVAKVDVMSRISPRPLINATGVIIHTNLGRAPLSHEAVEAMVGVARGYSDLEIDLTDGRRGSRQSHIQTLLCQLTGAESALVVNNNASALLLSLAALASGNEVIVSRGEAVEIGGGFRIPDVMSQSDASLVEVGTTNRTYISDYENAITEDTGALLKVHTSNFRITGFVHSPQTPDLVVLGQRYGIPLIHDIGSGCFLDTKQFGLSYEPRAQDSVSDGADLVLFSGDKLLGGPQAGIIVGRKKLIQKLERHPLARAVRIDKINLVALTATLLHYLRNEALEKIPTWRMISVAADVLANKALQWSSTIGNRASVIESRSTIGGGSLPGETLPTSAVALAVNDLPGGADAVMCRLRHWNPPIVGVIEGERVILDPRTVLSEEEEELLQAVQCALSVAG